MVIRVESSYHSKAFHWDSWSEIPISSAIEMFFLFFTSSLMNYIINQTNQFALESMGGEKFAKWTEVTVEELQAYTGFMTLMGLVKLPSIYDYWQRDEIYHYSPVASRITRDRFFELHRITRNSWTRNLIFRELPYTNLDHYIVASMENYALGFLHIAQSTLDKFRSSWHKVRYHHESGT